MMDFLQTPTALLDFRISTAIKHCYTYKDVLLLHKVWNSDFCTPDFNLLFIWLRCSNFDGCTVYNYINNNDLPVEEVSDPECTKDISKP